MTLEERKLERAQARFRSAVFRGDKRALNWAILRVHSLIYGPLRWYDFTGGKIISGERKGCADTVHRGSVPPLVGEEEGFADAFAFEFAKYLNEFENYPKCDEQQVLAAFGPNFRLHWRWAGKEAHSNILERRDELRRQKALNSNVCSELELIDDLLGDILNRARRRNAQAHMLARAVARTFRHLGRPVKFGIHPYLTKGEREKEWKLPSTHFGLAVLHSFELTGIEANWDAPTRAACINEQSSSH